MEIPKNTTETLRLERRSYRGINLIDVRVWTGRPEDPEARPTHKGLSLRPETWREVLPHLEARLGEAMLEGLLEGTHHG